MLNENAKRLVAALRSGEYTQTAGVLHRLEAAGNRPAGHCCLGVACDLFADELDLRKVPDLHIEGFGAGDDIEYDYLPEVVRTHLGFATASGTFDDGDGCSVSLADLNDEGATFSEIADTIESIPNGLFA